MNRSFRNILFLGALAMGANSLLIAQTTNPWFEGWYRAKFGRPSPTEQARIDAAKATEPTNAVQADVKAGMIPAPVNTWFEQWYRDKYGRPSPTEEARIEAQRASVAPRAEVPAKSAKAAAPANTWFENWYRDKYGRPSPQEEARANAQGR